jgi:hypothetical protein
MTSVPECNCISKYGLSSPGIYFSLFGTVIFLRYLYYIILLVLVLSYRVRKCALQIDEAHDIDSSKHANMK